MNIVLFILGGIAFVVILGFLITYLQHVLSPICLDDKYAYGNHKDFFKVIKPIEDKMEVTHNNHIRYGVIDIYNLYYEFDGVYMITNPVSFIIIDHWANKMLKKHKKAVKEELNKNIMWRK